MNVGDYRGPRGSLAGTNFHELWALHQAMKLLDVRSNLAAVTVEGFGQRLKATEDPGDYDGVDCTLIYGDADVAKAERVEIIQLKYSGSNPQAAWTIPKLTKSDATRVNNSVLRRLGSAFKGISQNTSGNISVRFVSNQYVAGNVAETFARLAGGKDVSGSTRTLLRKATGLSNPQLLKFAEIVDFTSRTGSRFQIEEELLLEISRWTDADANSTLELMLGWIRKLMYPENARRAFSRETMLLIIAGSPSQDSLFPCPSDFAAPPKGVIRSAARDIAAELISGSQRVCVHGGAGCGKTTVLQQLLRFLPAVSQLVPFDCYGGGRYLDASRTRHKAGDAFVQVSNEMAITMDLPLFLTRTDRTTARSVFKRLVIAGESLLRRNADALLLIAIDAADNSFTAARHFGDRSFVEDLISIRDLPKNVRLVLTCRTARLFELNLPLDFKCLPLSGFTREESAQFVALFLPHPSQHWIDDFHNLSGGVPRIESYALQTAIQAAEDPLSILQPSGHTLDRIFEGLFLDALQKFGLQQEFTLFCAALIVLPRPIPVALCGTVVGLPEDTIRDLCLDLAPGLRLESNEIAFADEDIEEFIRERAQEKEQTVADKAASLLWEQRTRDAYAATHVAAILFSTDRTKDLLQMIETDPEPTILADPILRREVRLQRIKLGVRLASEQQDLSAVIRAIMSGAEAIRSDDAITNLLESNIDLAVAFAEESVTRRVLTHGTKPALQGPLLAELMLKSALRGDGTSVRAYRRQYRAWLDARDLVDKPRGDKSGGKRIYRWDISVRDVGAITEAELLISGAEEGLSRLFLWTPRSIVLRVAELIVPRMLARGRSDLVSDILHDNRVQGMFRCWLLVPLARAGHRPAIELFRKALADKRIPRLANLRKARFDYGQDTTYQFFDVLLSTCELSLAHLRADRNLRAMLEDFSDRSSRQSSQLWAHDIERIAILVRAYCLLCLIDEKTATVGDFLGQSSKTETDDSERRRIEELNAVASAFIAFFCRRAQLLLAENGSKTAIEQLKEAALSVHAQDYRFPRHNRHRLYELMMGSIVDLTGFVNAEPAGLVRLVLSVKGEQVSDTGHEFLLALHRASVNIGTHSEILAWASHGAQSIGVLRCTANEKIQAYLALARLVYPISAHESEAFFRSAHETTEDLDVDSRHQLRAIGCLLGAAKPHLDADQRRSLACSFGTLTSNAALSIGEEQGFPWRETARTLGEVDPSVALAAISSWEDQGLASRSLTLEAAIDGFHLTSIGRGATACALNVLLESESVATSAIEWAREDADLPGVVLDDLCIDSLIFGFNQSARKIVAAVADSEYKDNPTNWLKRLRSTTVFSLKSEPKMGSLPKAPRGFDVPAHPYTSAAEISAAVQAGRSTDHWIKPDEILGAVRQLILPANRIPHLEAMMSVPAGEVRVDELVRYLEAVREAWPTMAVATFVDGAVLQLLKTRLPELSEFLIWGETHTALDRAVQLSSNRVACLKPMIEGIATGLNLLSAATLYEICGHMAPLFSADDVAQALFPYLQRLLGDVDQEKVQTFDGIDIPSSSTDALARYLFALLSDIEIATRWRAAHCLRRLVRYGDKTVLKATLELWQRKADPSFRFAKAPFYSQAARLWLMICLARLAKEAPGSVAPHVDLIVAALQDQDYPHPAVRSFAQDALRAMESAGVVKLTPKQREVVDTANTSSIPKAVRPWVATAHSKQPEKKPRFDFNFMDTIRYWFEPALNVFAEISLDELRNEAEHWIVDRWKVDPKFSTWRDEPRQKRLREQDWNLRSNDHGNHPAIEDYRTYLEWYSLECAIGSLMASHALAISRYDDSEVDEFQRRLKWQKLSEQPYWLADLLSPKPCETRFWTTPPAGEEWQSTAEDLDFVRELMRGESPSHLVLSSWHRTFSDDFDWGASVSSALVEPVNAMALVRALQTAEEPMDYKLPDGADYEDDRFDIAEPEFKLSSCLQAIDNDGGIDEKDPLCFETSRTQVMPAKMTAPQLMLSDRTVSWPSKDGVTYSYERWKSQRDINGEYQGAAIKTEGHRLFADVTQVLKYLQTSGRDLILEVRISRKRGGRHQVRKEEKHLELEGRFDGVILLRADGTIHTMDGCLGAWPISS